MYQLAAIYVDDFTDKDKQGYHKTIQFRTTWNNGFVLPNFQFNFPTSSTLSAWKLIKDDGTEIVLTADIAQFAKTTIGSYDNFIYDNSGTITATVPIGNYKYYITDGSNEVWSEWFCQTVEI